MADAFHHAFVVKNHGEVDVAPRAMARDVTP